MYSGLPNTFFVHDGVGLGMVRPGEPRLRPDSRSGEPGLLRSALTRLAEALRLPEALRPVASR